MPRKDWDLLALIFLSVLPGMLAPLPPAQGDRDLLGLAVHNLVENALRLMSAKDSIEVRALEDGKAIVVEVADSGEGIDSADLSKICRNSTVARMRVARREASLDWRW